MITIPVLQITAGVVVALVVLQVVRRLTADSTNPIAVGLNDGITFLTAP